MGIIALAVLAGMLLVIFRGQTDALINLFAVGVFVAFTLSQAGMVVHWWRLRAEKRGWWRKFLTKSHTCLKIFVSSLAANAQKI